MTTLEIGETLVALCQQGKFVEAIQTLYADDAVSAEPMDYKGHGREMHGKAAVERKTAEWLDENEVHSITVRGPFVSPEQFAVIFHLDWTDKDGQRVSLEEVAIYDVVDGKVTREEFLYGNMKFS
jgi:hypothetical protein